MTTSTASSASFLAILARPARSNLAVRETAGSALRAAITCSYSRSSESAICHTFTEPRVLSVNAVVAPRKKRGRPRRQRPRTSFDLVFVLLVVSGASDDGAHGSSLGEHGERR